jgi:ABC-type sulfate transport system substrate-binding protein
MHKFLIGGARTGGAAASSERGQFHDIKLFTIDKNFGGWRRAKLPHFTDGGVYDQIVAENNR